MATTSALVVSVDPATGTEQIISVDANIFGTGDEASRPASGTNVGDMYVVLDTGGQVYRMDIWDGSEWQPLSPAASFGANFESVNDAGDTSTTSTTYIEKLSLTTTVLPVGTYVLFASFSLEADAANKSIPWRIQQNDTTTLIESTHRSQLPDNAVPLTVLRTVFVASAGSQQFDLDFRRESGGPSYTTTCSDATFLLWRIL